MDKNKRRFTYKGFTVIWNKVTLEYDLFTKDEMEQPTGFRTSKWNVVRNRSPARLSTVTNGEQL